jgi:hypothetical protein
MSVLDYLNRLLNQITYTVNLALQIVTALVSSGWYIVIRDAATVTGDIHGLLEDPTCGQVAQCNKLDTVITDLATLASDIAALGNPQQTSVPVTLPTVPPAGYGGPTSSANAAAVWSFASTDEATAMGQIMSILSVFLRVMEDSGTFQSRLGPGFSYNVGLENFINNPNTSFVTASIADIQPTDASLLDFLQREIGSVTWHQTGLGTYWADVGGGNALIQCQLSEGEFEFLRMLAGGPPVHGLPLVPPVWPGITNVTLGTPVAFSGSALSVAGPMDGVIVTITSVNQPLPHYAYGTAIAWGRLGGLTFVDDNGEAEEYQLFGFVDAIYSPRGMVQAQSCQIRNTSGIVGTVTPWTKS